MNESGKAGMRGAKQRPPDIPLRGARVRVYWTEEKRWFRGSVGSERMERGKWISEIIYDDGDHKWHNLSSGGEFWMYLPTPKSPKRKAFHPEAYHCSDAPHLKSTFQCTAATPSQSLAATATQTSTAIAAPDPVTADAATEPTVDRIGQSCKKRRLRAPLEASSNDPLPPPPPRPLPVEPQIEILPCGVVKLRGFVSPEQQEELFDTTMIAGWDHRVVGTSEACAGPDARYTGAKGAPDILLHYNYYAVPLQLQPPPMQVLRIAHEVFRAFMEERVRYADAGAVGLDMEEAEEEEPTKKRIREERIGGALHRAGAHDTWRGAANRPAKGRASSGCSSRATLVAQDGGTQGNGVSATVKLPSK